MIKKTSFSLLNFITEHYILIFIITSSIFIRFWNLSNPPFFTNVDEISAGLDGWFISQNLKNRFNEFLPIIMRTSPSGIGIEYMPSGWIYLTVPFFKIFGPGDLGVKFPAALFGIISLIITYKMMLVFFSNKNYALLGTFILSISPWHLVNSRVWEPLASLNLFIVIFLYLFIKIIKIESENHSLFYIIKSQKGNFHQLKNKIKELWITEAISKKEIFYCIFLGFFAAFSTNIYYQAWVTIPVIFGLLTLFFINGNLKKLTFSWASYLSLIVPYFTLIFVNSHKYLSHISFTTNRNHGDFTFIDRMINIAYTFAGFFSPNFWFKSIGNTIWMTDLSNKAHPKVPISNTNFTHMYIGEIIYHEYFTIFFYLGFLITILILFSKRNNILKNYPLSFGGCKIFIIWIFSGILPAILAASYHGMSRACMALPVGVFFIITGIILCLHLFKTLNINLSRTFTFVILILGLNSLYQFHDVFWGPYKDQIRERYFYGTRLSFEYLKKNEDKFDKCYILPIFDKQMTLLHTAFYTGFKDNKLFAFNLLDNFKKSNKEINIGKYSIGLGHLHKNYLNKDFYVGHNVRDNINPKKIWYKIYHLKKNPRIWVMSKN